MSLLERESERQVSAVTALQTAQATVQVRRVVEKKQKWKSRMILTKKQATVKAKVK